MQRNIKTTVAITFSSFCPKTLHFIATFWQGRGHNRHVIAVCHAHGCDRPSHHPRCLQSCGHTEHGSTLEGGVINAIVLFAFPQTTRILLAHVKQNRDIPLTKEVHDMSARTVLTSGNDTFLIADYWSGTATLNHFDSLVKSALVTALLHCSTFLTS